MLLYNCAKNWEGLLNTEYLIEYFYLKKHIKIHLIFQYEDFEHLAGFQYLGDIELPTYSNKNLIEKILDNKITDEMIQKSKEYQKMVEPRLQALSNINEFLLSFYLYHYNPKKYPFYTDIKANFLLQSKTLNNVSFFFAVKNENIYTGCSIFEKTIKDFTINQKRINIQKITKMDTTTNTSIVIYKNSSYDRIIKEMNKSK